MRLPDRLRSFPEDERFAAEPAAWHVYGRVSDLRPLWFLRHGLFRPLWMRWVKRYVAAIARAADERRQRDEPLGV